MMPKHGRPQKALTVQAFYPISCAGSLLYGGMHSRKISCLIRSSSANLCSRRSLSVLYSGIQSVISLYCLAFGSKVGHYSVQIGELFYNIQISF